MRLGGNEQSILEEIYMYTTKKASIRELLGSLYISIDSMKRSLGSLIKKGLITRQVERYEIKFKITKKGKKYT